MKTKSLGTLVYPHAELTSVSNGRAEITLTARGKRIKIELGISCARKLTDLAREIVGKQRAHVISQWSSYKHLRDYTGYKAPDGQE